MLSKSDASATRRISTTPAWPSGLGIRLIHSTHSSRSRHWRIQNPPTSSLVSANGPSTTLGSSVLEKTIRAPCELGVRPSPASITPALTSSSLNFAISVSSSALGPLPASESSFALTITMNRIAVSLRSLPACASNGHAPDRQRRPKTFRAGKLAAQGRPGVDNPDRGESAAVAVLPDDLSSALDEELARHPVARLAQSVDRLSTRYRQGDAATSPILSSEADVAAY